MLDIIELKLGDSVYKCKPSFENVLLFERRVCPIGSLAARLDGVKLPLEDLGAFVYYMQCDKSEDEIEAKKHIVSIAAEIYYTGLVNALPELQKILEPILTGPKKPQAPTQTE